MSKTSRVCPVKTCGAVIPLDQHMCHPHWTRVPRAIAKRVVAAYNQMRRGGVGAQESYKTAIDEACAAVKAPTA